MRLVSWDLKLLVGLFLFASLFYDTVAVHAQIKPDGTTAVATKSALTAPTGYVTGTTVNYITTWTPQQPYTLETDVSSTSRLVAEVTQSTQYFDGLGRPLQAVDWQASPNQKDIVAPVIYDAYGREQYKYLPYTATDATGTFKVNPFGDQSTFYSSTYLSDQGSLKNEQYYYSHTVYEASPLNRAAKSFAPGNSWAGSEVAANGTTRTAVEKAVSVQYLVNNSSDVVRIWDIGFQAFGDANNIPTSASTPADRYYAAGQLYKTVTLDEHSNAVVEYKDLEGHVVLKKVQIGAVASDYSGYTGFYCTFYVYDDLGELRFVIPPKAVAKMIAAGSWTLTTDIVKELCFRYEYDQRQRMSAKKVPGADWIYMVYDSRDRLVYSQDGNMRGKSPQQWAYTFYDDLNRPAETGIMTYTGTWANLVTSAAGAANSTITNGTEAGSFTNGTPADLVVSSRDYTAGQYYNATNSVTWQDGFSTEDGATITAQIVSSTPPSFSLSNETINSKPLPTTGTYTYYPLTYAYYDGYSFGSTKAYSTTNNSSLGDGGNPAATLEAVTPTASNMTKGMATGARVRVLEDPANLNAGAWIETVTWYDDKGRAAQVQSDNYKGGTDIVSTRYNFTNKPVSSYLAHSNPAAGKSGTNAIGVYTSLLYDHEGRVKNVKKTVIYQSTSYSRTVVQNTYDALGQLKIKAIGQKSSSDATPIESDNYAYNIRGWLKGVNWYSGQTYASQVNADKTNATPKWFAFDLSYDWGMMNVLPQYNGNIAGQRWESGGDNKERAYGYAYDAANRLMKGDFTQNNSGWGADGVLNFDVKMGDGAAAGTAYDENGNIKMMQQWGLKGVSSTQIDKMTYNYSVTELGNRLTKVTEDAAIGNTNNNVGDFTDKNRDGTDDYTYDVNGNLTADKNKKITGIIYNHLNLPWQITVTNDDGSAKGTITYIYDAAGNKLEKRVSEVASSSNGNQSKLTQTAYIGGFVYQNNVLQFLSHEEGRIRLVSSIVSGSPTTNFVYDYFLKDHLGNVRMVLTDEVKQDVYPAATLEATGIATEKAYYDIQDGNVVANPVTLSSATGGTYYNNNGNPPYNTNPNVNTSAQSAQMYKLNGANGVKTGLGITLKVMAGDNVAIYGKSYYHLNGGQTATNTYAVSSALLSLLNSFAGGSAVSGKGVTGATLNGNTPTTGPLTTLVNSNPNPAGNVPKAGVNWILFDEQFRPVANGYDAVNNAGDYVKTHNLTASVTQNGYLYMYCSDESNVDVYFDNLQLIHNRGPLLEETHYYPFGLTMQGISSQAAGSLNNKYEYNGKEKQEKEWSNGSGLDEYDYGARMYDAQIGRWYNLDCEAIKYNRISPYAYVANKPTIAFDPDGKKIIFVNGFLGFGSPLGGPAYWGGSNSPFVQGAQHYLNDNTTPYFTDYNFEYMKAENEVDRRNGGREYAEAHYKDLIEGMDIKKDVFNIISHSMGGSFSEGMIDYLKSKGWKVETTIHFNTWSPGAYEPNKDIVQGQATEVIDATIVNDIVQGISEIEYGNRDIPNADIYYRKESKKDWDYRHRDLIDSDEVWKNLTERRKEIKMLTRTWQKVASVINKWLQKNPNIKIEIK